MRLAFRSMATGPAASLALIVAGGLFAAPLPVQARLTAHSARDTPSALQKEFTVAAREFRVPEQVLLAVSYSESRWEGHNGRYDTDGGYGLMNLTDVTAAMVAGQRDGAAALTAPAAHTLAEAARLTGTPAARLREDDLQNLRGGAALLASYERSLTGGTPDDPAAWYPAVARYSRYPDEEGARGFADGVFDLLADGADRTTAAGQRVRLTARPDPRPDRAAPPRLRAVIPAASGPAGCPTGMTCSFVPASAAGYQSANRPSDGLDVRYIVIHDTESSYESAISAFQDPAEAVAADYVMRSADGAVTRMVPDRDLAFHAGNYWFNMHSVGIEHEGFAARGATWYTEAQYRATATLVRYLAGRYGIPLDRRHVIGHDNVPGPVTDDVAAMHWDPGPYWDWTHFMDLLGVHGLREGSGPPAVGSAVTITPGFAANEQSVRVCGRAAGDTEDDTDVPHQDCAEQTQGSNFLYVRTAPDDSAPLFADPALHPDGGTGTRRIDDWGDTVCAGQQFVVADRSGDWTAIWFSGAKVWFHNPGGVRTAPAPGATVVSALPSAAPARVYGVAYPRAPEYPAGLRPSVQTPLGMYGVPSGQEYVASPVPAPTDDFATDPPDTVVTGGERYYTVQFGHRLALLNAADLAVRTA